MLFHDIFAHHPKEREAIIDQDRSVTYGEFQDLVERWAAYFEALGVKKGDRVGLVSSFMRAAILILSILSVISSAAGRLWASTLPAVLPLSSAVLSSRDMAFLKPRLLSPSTCPIR